MRPVLQRRRCCRTSMRWAPTAARSLAARMGVVRYVRWLLSLQSGWRGRVRLIPVLLAPTDDDRAALALPRRLEWAYPVVRVLRLAARHLARRWRG